MTALAISGNTYPVKDQLKALGCRWNSAAKAWVAPNAAVHARAVALVPAPKAGAQAPAGKVEKVEEIFRLLQAALRHGLKRPKLLVACGDDKAPRFLRLKVATGDRVRFPGSIDVTSTTKHFDPNSGEDRYEWFGRIHLDGRFEASPRQPVTVGLEILQGLRELASDPAKAAARYGFLTGHCSFCGRRLTDDRSKLVGYGPDCADYRGLPWGERSTREDYDLSPAPAAQDDEWDREAAAEEAYERQGDAESRALARAADFYFRT
jgi:hypothetical protein